MLKLFMVLLPLVLVLDQQLVISGKRQDNTLVALKLLLGGS